MNTKLYILVLKKLSKSQRTCQAVHAVAGWLIENPECDWKNRTVVLLGVDSVEEWEERLKKKYYVFKEPHWNGLSTALASPYIGEDVNHLSLLK